MTPLQTNSDPIRTFQRKQTTARRAGKRMPCNCGETRVAALIPESNSSICAECQRKKRGHRAMDNHHVAGRKNSKVTVAVPVNDHRAILSEAQFDWPWATLENPDGCPLLAAAACIRGFVDFIRFLIDKLLMWIAELLESLSAFLVEKLGPDWWLNTPLAQFARKGKNHGRN
jgi:hypothetical protein